MVFEAAESIPAGQAVAVDDTGRMRRSKGATPILVASEDIPEGQGAIIGEDGVVHVVADGDPYAGARVTVPVRLTFLDLPDGLHENVSPDLYYERIKGVANKSGLDRIHKAPAAYAAWVEGADQEETAALAFGKALHAAVLEPASFAALYTTEPDFGDCRKAENKRTRDEWRKANEGKVFLSSADAERIAGMSRAVREHPVAGQLFVGGLAEVTVKWTDPDTGLTCKLRADYYRRELGLVVDLKSTADGAEKPFARSVSSYGYHRQEAFYKRGFEAVKEPFKIFVFVAVEKEAPYLVSLYTLDDDASRLGAQSIQGDLETLAACLETDEWPGYPTEIQTLSLPPWAA